MGVRTIPYLTTAGVIKMARGTLVHLNGARATADFLLAMDPELRYPVVSHFMHEAGGITSIDCGVGFADGSIRRFRIPVDDFNALPTAEVVTRDR